MPYKSLRDHGISHFSEPEAIPPWHYPALAYHGKHEHQEPQGGAAWAPEQPEPAQRPPLPGLVTNRKARTTSTPATPKPGDPTPAAATYQYQEGHNSREGFRS